MKRYLKYSLLITLSLLLSVSVASFAQHHKSSHSKSYRYKAPKTYKYKPTRTYQYKSRSSYGSGYIPRYSFGHRANYHYGVQRDSKGRIKRSAKARYEFMKMTGYPHGRKGYVIDHIIPLKDGGCDCPANMQWQTKKAAKEKDKWE